MTFVKVCHRAFVGMPEHFCRDLQRHMITKFINKLIKSVCSVRWANLYFSSSPYGQYSLTCVSDVAMSMFEAGYAMRSSVKMS